MKVNIEIDCTPEEARTFLGLPDTGTDLHFHGQQLPPGKKRKQERNAL